MTLNTLIVDDDPVQRRLAEAALTRDGMTVTACEDGESALDILTGDEAAAFSAIVLDLVMPGIDGIAVLNTLKERGTPIPVIVQTAQGSIDVAIKAMRAGAFDFLVKPVAAAKLAQAVQDAVKVASTEPAPATPPAPRSRRIAKVELIGNSPEMERVHRLIAKAAASDIPVLIEGESGTGKELVARAIAAQSARANKPLVVVNCGAIPDSLVESILFGHEKGAFTGATEKHTGKFVEADGGTLFLDEIGELPLPAQVKLLRAIQDGEIEPVGARGVRKVDVRLISATNRDLIAAVREGRFREDLFYRLNVFPILTPSLRMRPADVPALALHMAERQYRTAGHRQSPSIGDDALAVLSAYDWPGNVRQLENEILRALVLNETGRLTAGDFDHIEAQITPSLWPNLTATAFPVDSRVGDTVEAPRLQPGDEARALPTAADNGTNGPALPLLTAEGHVRSLANVESSVIGFAMAHYDGQMSEIARRLGIGRSTLYRKIREYEIDDAR